MNIIFLDVDGVLNNDACMILHEKHLHPDCVEFFTDALDKILEHKEIKIVISSTWRKCADLSVFQERIWDNYTPCNIKLLDNLHEDWRTGYSKDGFRGGEVVEWLSRHPEVEKYVCVDDDSDFLPEQPLIQTMTEYGFGWNESKMLQAFFLKEILSKFYITESSFKIKKLQQQRKFIKEYLS